VARLIFQDQNGRERAVDIGPQRNVVTIGRNADCIIQTNNASVSREHAVVMFQNGAYMVQDPPPGPPTNGTYINGQRLRPGEVGRLSQGDELRCGNFSIRLEAGGESGAGYEPPSSARSQPSAQPGQRPQYAQQQMPADAPSRDEFEALKRENIGLKTVEQRQREQIEQLQNEILDRERSLADMERRTQHHDNVVEGLNDKIAKLREQLELQKEQLRDLRDQLKRRNDENEDLQFKLQRLEEAMNSSTDATANQEATIADLQVQINQRDRKIEDLQRELDLAQFALTTEKDNVERLEMTLEQVNDQTSGFERYRQDMEKVVEQHESTIVDLRRAIDERDREINRLHGELEAASADGAHAHSELRQRVQKLEKAVQTRDEDIAALEDQLRAAERRAGKSLGGPDEDVEAMRREIEELKDELEVARAASGQGGGRRDLVQQINQLKRENRDLRMQVDDGGGGGGGGAGDDALRRKIVELENELEETRDRLRTVQRSGSSDGELSEELRKRAKEVYQAINDVVSQWRDDMQSMELYVEDLHRLVEAFQRIDMSSLNTVDRVRLEGVIEEIDPKITFEEIESVIDKNQTAAGSIKSSLRDLREVVL